MDANQNPPSEREWTIVEREEFFASQDARTGLSLHHRLLHGPYDAVIEQEMTIEEAKRRYPNTPIPGEK
jgi:hypothetical protein